MNALLLREVKKQNKNTQKKDKDKGKKRKMGGVDFFIEAINLLALQVGREPLETLVETITRSGASCLDVPVALAERVEAKLVGDLGSVHGVGEILNGTRGKQSLTNAQNTKLPACWRKRAEGLPGARPR